MWVHNYAGIPTRKPEITGPNHTYVYKLLFQNSFKQSQRNVNYNISNDHKYISPITRILRKTRKYSQK